MDLHTFGLLAAVLSGIAFALYQISIKRLHGAVPNLPFLAIPRLLGLLFPFWLLVFILMNQNSLLSFNTSFEALRWPLLWAACTIATTTGLVWLLRTFSLSEVAGYKKALITMGAATMDVLLFGVHFPLLTLLAIALLLSGAIGLSSARNRLPTRLEWCIIGVWCLVLVGQISVYKYGLQQQPEVLAHSVLAQLFATGGYALLWLIPAVRATPLPPMRLLWPLLTCFLAGTLLEGFAYAGLPLALVLVITMLPAALMATHDLWRGDLPRSRTTWVALGLLVGGFMLLIFK